MTAPTATLADAHVEAQSALADRLPALVAAIMQSIDLSDLPGSTDRVAKQLQALRFKYGRASVSLAVSHYRQLRADAGLSPSIRLSVPSVADDDLTTPANWALSGLYGPQNDEPVTVGTREYAPIQQRLADAETKLTGVADKTVIGEGREATLSFVQQDKQAKRWARQPEPDPCAFCALITSRGPVFKADTVRFEAHDHCRCQPVPVFGKWQPSEQIQAWESLYSAAVQARREERPRSQRTKEPLSGLAVFRRLYDQQHP